MDINIKDFHPAHAVGFGVLAGYIAQRYGYNPYKTGVFVGVGSYVYMDKFGHTLKPWKNKNNNNKAKLENITGIVPYTDPDKTDNKQPQTTSTELLSSDYYDGFNDRLADALKKGYSDLNDYVALHKNDSNLADEIYQDLGVMI